MDEGKSPRRSLRWLLPSGVAGMILAALIAWAVPAGMDFVARSAVWFGKIDEFVERQNQNATTVDQRLTKLETSTDRLTTDVGRLRNQVSGVMGYLDGQRDGVGKHSPRTREAQLPALTPADPTFPYFYPNR